ncbi:hypothetical protein ACWDBW_47205 [Streptomyces sp. NPDC001107]
MSVVTAVVLLFAAVHVRVLVLDMLLWTSPATPKGRERTMCGDAHDVVADAGVGVEIRIELAEAEADRQAALRGAADAASVGGPRQPPCGVRRG